MEDASNTFELYAPCIEQKLSLKILGRRRDGLLASSSQHPHALSGIEPATLFI